MMRAVRVFPFQSNCRVWPEPRGELCLPALRARSLEDSRNFFHTSVNQKRSATGLQKNDPLCDPNLPRSSSSESSGGRTFYKVFGSTLLIIALPVGYALYDPKFRSQLEGYFPFMKPALKAISAAPGPSGVEKPKPSLNPSLPSFTRPKEPERKVVETPKKDEIKVEKVASKMAGPAASAVAATVASQSKADAEKENKELRKEILAANNKINDLETKVKTLEANQAAATKAAESPLIVDLVHLLDGRTLSDEERKLVDAVVANTTERLEAEFDRYIEELEDEHEWELQLQLKRQIAAHADTIREALRRQEVESEKHFLSRLERRIEEERQRFNLQAAGALGRLKGIEDALAARAKNDRAGMKAQYLWHTSHALYNALKDGNPAGKTPEQRMEPLSKYINLAKIFSESHPFVLSILRAVPEEALVRGVHTEESLRERFSLMRHAARRVALIDDQHNSLYRYFLSYLQSMLIDERRYDLSLEKDVDRKRLDTFRILGTARRCVQRGDLETAVRFVGQLQGEPRTIAQDWLKEARLHLETQQIAKLLLAHASAVGLTTIPVDVKI